MPICLRLPANEARKNDKLPILNKHNPFGMINNCARGLCLKNESSLAYTLTLFVSFRRVACMSQSIVRSTRKIKHFRAALISTVYLYLQPYHFYSYTTTIKSSHKISFRTSLLHQLPPCQTTKVNLLSTLLLRHCSRHELTPIKSKYSPPGLTR